jgi:hypothetical protein
MSAELAPSSKNAGAGSGLANESMNNEVSQERKGEAKKRMTLPLLVALRMERKKEAFEHSELDDRGRERKWEGFGSC